MPPLLFASFTRAFSIALSRKTSSPFPFAVSFFKNFYSSICVYTGVSVSFYTYFYLLNISGNIGNSTATVLLSAGFMAVSNICCLPPYQSRMETIHLFPAVSFFILTNTLCTPYPGIRSLPDELPSYFFQPPIF